VVAAAVGVVGRARLAALVPLAADRLLAVEEDEAVCESPPLRLFEHARDFEQRPGRRAAVVRADEVEIFEPLGVVVARDDDRLFALAGEFGDDVHHADFAVRSIGRPSLFGHVQRAGPAPLERGARGLGHVNAVRRALTFERGDDVAARLFDGLRARGARA
jgi:hypothetical protein